MIGHMKVYAALMKYVKANGYNETVQVMEVYDIPNNKIRDRKKNNKSCAVDSSIDLNSIQDMSKHVLCFYSYSTS